MKVLSHNFEFTFCLHVRLANAFTLLTFFSDVVVCVAAFLSFSFILFLSLFIVVMYISISYFRPFAVSFVLPVDWFSSVSLIKISIYSVHSVCSRFSSDLYGYGMKFMWEILFSTLKCMKFFHFFRCCMFCLFRFIP